MAQFRPKKLDLGCFVNIMNIRDHTKRKVFEQHEPERYDSYILPATPGSHCHACKKHLLLTKNV